MPKQCERFKDHPHVGDVRQTGMITAIELVKDKASKESYPWQERRGLEVYKHGLKNGALLRPLGDVIYFMTPYVITPEEIKMLVDVAEQGIELAVKKFPKIIIAHSTVSSARHPYFPRHMYMLLKACASSI